MYSFDEKFINNHEILMEGALLERLKREYNISIDNDIGLASAIRTEYSIKAIIEKNIEVEKLADDTANWQSDQAISKMTQWINKFGDKIEVVFSNNDVMALGALHVINSTDIFTTKPLVVGIDGINEALEAVYNGEMIGTVISDSKLQSKAIFDISYSLAKNNSVETIENLEKGKYIKTKHIKVTRENIKNFYRE